MNHHRSHWASLATIVSVLALAASACGTSAASAHASPPIKSSITKPGGRDTIVSQSPAKSGSRSGQGKPQRTTAPAGNGGSGAPLYAGCQTPLAPGSYDETITSGGVQRSYLLSVPSSGSSRTPLPVVIDFHGYGQTAAIQAAYTGLSAAGATKGVLVVTPQGVADRWNFVRRPTVGPSDVAFLHKVLDQLDSLACYDHSRVVATGISDGADMANTLGCALPTMITAIFAVAPSIVPMRCPVAPATVIEVHGTADPIVPFNGGGGDRPFPFQGTQAQPVMTRMNYWSTLDKCTSPPSSAAVATGVEALQWHCPPGHLLALYEILGGGHTWPGAAPLPQLGYTTSSVSATNAVIRLAIDPHALPWAPG